MSVFLPKSVSKREYLELRRKWNARLKAEGLEDIERLNSGDLEVDHRFQPTASSLGRASTNTVYNRTLANFAAQADYYLYFTHYTHQISYKYRSMHNYATNTATFADFRVVLSMYLDGLSVQEAYNYMLRKRDKKTNAGTPKQKPKSCIFFFKRIQESAAEFLAYFHANNMSGVD